MTATDGSSASASDDFELTVVDVNDAPTLALPLPDQSATQDVPFSYSLAAGSFADIDGGDSLVLSARLADGTALPAWLRFDAATHTFSGTPGNADVGTITVRVTAIDGSSASVSDDFELTVVDVNDAPTLALPLPDQSATQDVPFSYSLAAGSFADIDGGDSLVLSARLADGTALPAWLRFDAATHTFSGTPGNADVGTITVRVTAIDGSSASLSDDFELTVVDVNDAPQQLRTIDDLGATLGVPFAFTVPDGMFTDVDAGDSLSLTAQRSSGFALPGWLVFDAATRRFSGTPGAFDLGPLDIRLAATDRAGASADAEFTITVVAVNTPPLRVGVVADQHATEDVEFDFTVPSDTFADPDHFDRLGYAAARVDGGGWPAWLSFDAATRRFSGTPGAGDVGTLGVRVTATDRSGAEASLDFMLTVVHLNHAPRLMQPVPDQAATQDVRFEFALPAGSFADADAGDLLVYTARQADGSALPAWLRFDAATQRFSGTPGQADVGTIGVHVTATDPSGAAAGGDFAITVTDRNDAPRWVLPLSDQAATEDTAFVFGIDAQGFVDPDAGDRLSYTARLASGDPLPAWLHFDAQTLRFSGTPRMPDVTNGMQIEVIATDSGLATASAGFILRVDGINHAPRLDLPIADQSLSAGERLLLQLPPAGFVDPDAGDVLTYQATRLDGSALPGWLRFDPQQLSFTAEPAGADVGTLAVRVIATDGSGAAAQALFVIEVLDANPGGTGGTGGTDTPDTPDTTNGTGGTDTNGGTSPPGTPDPTSPTSPTSPTDTPAGTGGTDTTATPGTPDVTDGGQHGQQRRHRQHGQHGRHNRYRQFRRRRRVRKLRCTKCNRQHRQHRRHPHPSAAGAGCAAPGRRRAACACRAWPLDVHAGAACARRRSGERDGPHVRRKHACNRSGAGTWRGRGGFRATDPGPGRVCGRRHQPEHGQPQRCHPGRAAGSAIR